MITLQSRFHELHVILLQQGRNNWTDNELDKETQTAEELFYKESPQSGNDLRMSQSERHSRKPYSLTSQGYFPPTRSHKGLRHSMGNNDPRDLHSKQYYSTRGNIASFPPKPSSDQKRKADERKDSSRFNRNMRKEVTSKLSEDDSSQLLSTPSLSKLPSPSIQPSNSRQCTSTGQITPIINEHLSETKPNYCGLSKRHSIGSSVPHSIGSSVPAKKVMVDRNSNKDSSGNNELLDRALRYAFSPTINSHEYQVRMGAKVTLFLFL